MELTRQIGNKIPLGFKSEKSLTQAQSFFGGGFAFSFPCPI